MCSHPLIKSFVFLSKIPLGPQALQACNVKLVFFIGQNSAKEVMSLNFLLELQTHQKRNDNQQ
jgi:hypothetical protein